MIRFGRTVLMLFAIDFAAILQSQLRRVKGLQFLINVLSLFFFRDKFDNA